MFPFLTFDTSCPAHLLGLSRLPIRPRYTEVKCQPRLKISNFRTAKNELPVKVGLGPIGSSPVKFKWINFGHGQFEFESVLFFSFSGPGSLFQCRSWVCCLLHAPQSRGDSLSGTQPLTGNKWPSLCYKRCNYLDFFPFNTPPHAEG